MDSLGNAISAQDLQTICAEHISSIPAYDYFQFNKLNHESDRDAVIGWTASLVLNPPPPTHKNFPIITQTYTFLYHFSKE
jgi:hypothetical protein